MDVDEFLKDVEIAELLASYDEAARELLNVAALDGHFDGWSPNDLVWPQSTGIDVGGLERRRTLISHIYDGIPSRRDRRLHESYLRFAALVEPYHQANRNYLDVLEQFEQQGAGSAAEFLQLYQVVYLEALGRDEPYCLDAGEAALVNLKVARVPLSHAQGVAGKLKESTEATDPRWEGEYGHLVDGQKVDASLRSILSQIADRVVDFMAAGEHLAIRYNTFSNFIWFGISVWKSVSEIECLAARLEGHLRPRWHEKMVKYVRLAQGLLLKFLQAHSEDPAQIRPKDYWYGQEYSYLTRDMIDLTLKLIEGANALRRRARGSNLELDEIEVPVLLRNQFSGRFVEHGHVGRQRSIGSWRRRGRLLRWAALTRRNARGSLELEAANLAEPERLQAAWKMSLEWGRKTLELFEIEVDVSVDPRFEALAKALHLGRDHRKVVFFPTHQSVLDHPVMYSVMQSSQLLKAMGWEQPRPCALLARAGLTSPATLLRVGSKELSLLGIGADTADHLLEQVHGYVILRRSGDTGNPTREFAKLLEKRPGVVYGAGTTSAFELQCLPIQHALFAQLPSDTLFIPVIFRGIHGLWPKCPAGNLNISPGKVGGNRLSAHAGRNNPLAAKTFPTYAARAGYPLSSGPYRQPAQSRPPGIDGLAALAGM